MNSAAQQTFLTQTGAAVPLICGPMYPCSNPELVAAVSAAGGIGVVQPISLTYVHGHEYREGLRLINRLAAGRPIGFNALVEKSSRVYEQRMIRWVDIALEEGVRFFITSLGNPRWVVDKVHALGGVVYHDVITQRWGAKGRDEGVDGLAAFVEDYKKLLASTGEANAASLAKRFGIDIQTRKFWDDSLAIIGKQIDRFCEI